MCVCVFNAKSKWQGKTDPLAFNGNKIPTPRRKQIHTNTTFKIHVCKHQESLQEKMNHLYKWVRVIANHDRSCNTTTRNNREIDAYQTTTNDSYFFPLRVWGIHGCWSALHDHRTPCLPHTDSSGLYILPQPATVFEQAWEVAFNPFVAQSTVNSASSGGEKRKLHDVNQDWKSSQAETRPVWRADTEKFEPQT